MTPAFISALSDLVQISHQALLAGFFVFLRVGAALALLPVFGEQSVPPKVRLALALCLTVVVAPSVSDQIAPLLASDQVIGLPLATEVIAGLAIGMALRLFVLALQMAGTIIAQATSLSQFFGGAGVEPQPAIAQLLVVSGLALAVMAGLHVRMVEMIVLSYDLMPPGAFPNPGEVADWGLTQVARAVVLAFSLAAPCLIAALIYNVALGVINRAMPALMVSFIGAPALALGGLVFLLLVLPLALGLWIGAFAAFLNDPFGAAP